jgi:hypothetical protein
MHTRGRLRGPSSFSPASEVTCDILVHRVLHRGRGVCTSDVKHDPSSLLLGYGRRMRAVIVLAVASILLVALLPTASAARRSGIRGTVIKSPTSPVCREGVPCSAPAGGIVLVALRAGVRVATTTTSDAGTYRFVLGPGTYLLRSLRSSMFGSPAPRTVRVRRGRFTVVNFEIDTGIR